MNEGLNNRKSSFSRTKQLTTLAVLAATAFLVHFLKIKVLFLSLELKDVVITIGGFIFGPLSAGLIAVVVAFLEMVTVSETGPIGFVMNVLASVSFACAASFIYKRRQTLRGAVTGLLAGVFLMTGVMLLWNYLITPLYMSATRDEVAAMLVPLFLPFNLLKGFLIAAVTMLLYKPAVSALRRAGLAPPSEGDTKKGGFHVGVLLVSLLVLATCIFCFLVFTGKI